MYGTRPPRHKKYVRYIYIFVSEWVHREVIDRGTCAVRKHALGFRHRVQPTAVMATRRFTLYVFTTTVFKNRQITSDTISN